MTDMHQTKSWPVGHFRWDHAVVSEKSMFLIIVLLLRWLLTCYHEKHVIYGNAVGHVKAYMEV